MWGIDYNTQNKEKVHAGDLALFYISSRNNQFFIARCRVKSKLIRKGITKGNDLTILFPYYLKIGDVRPFSKFVRIRPIKNRLKFIKNKKMFWSHLQGGIKRIPLEDFETICDKSE